MRQKHALIPTLRTVAEAETASHRLLLRGGFIRQLAAGVYTFLPLGNRVLRKVETIIREEMDRIGAQELLMPTLHPAELWQESGRWANYGPELFKVTDRHERNFAMGPTHEEVVTDLLRGEINTYKKLPMTVYQIQTKFRDEKRPRSGILRGREFLMKDAYSFHADLESLDRMYRNMYDAYVSIFTRLGLDFRAVEADSGAMGGKGTHEFMALSDVGEDTIAMCESCDYAANVEMAAIRSVGSDSTGSVKDEVPPVKKVATPNKASIEEVAGFLGLPTKRLVKSLLFLVDGEPVLVLVRGDHEANDVKVKNLLEGSAVSMADEETVFRVAGTLPGFVGPVGLKQPVRIIADHAVAELDELVVGANDQDAHLLHVKIGRDFHVDEVADLRLIRPGDACPRCGGVIGFRRGIEVGHVFKLGTRYSEVMNARFLDADGKERPFIMGCYGIGVSRVVAAIAEQHRDEHGIIWPVAVAPFQVHLITVNAKNDEQVRLAETLYDRLRNAGYEVLYDDRPERAGVKFKDADLIGIPVRIIVGAKAGEGMVELTLRRSGETAECSASEVQRQLPDWLKRSDISDQR
ncbi:proline--tRNA ligase [Staphylospora marina]|uniref:proline--tRNA ligase n=1 Tax=Staphylospora marina TaxID=2490858 RepID=UPI000F5BDE10|nr:proline--tRNA ligase [Staphylospora marina]